VAAVRGDDAGHASCDMVTARPPVHVSLPCGGQVTATAAPVRTANRLTPAGPALPTVSGRARDQFARLSSMGGADFCPR
jgi:hypothetical protein